MLGWDTNTGKKMVTPDYTPGFPAHCQANFHHPYDKFVHDVIRVIVIGV